MATQQDLESFVTSAACPDDFDSFWDGVRAELAEIPLDATAETDALRSTDTTKVYQGKFTGASAGWRYLPGMPCRRRGTGRSPRFCICPGTNRSRP